MRCAVTAARVAVDAVKPMHADAMPQAVVRRNPPTIANDVLRWAKFDLDRAVWHLPGERIKTGADLIFQIKGIEGIYNRHDYFEERRQAMEPWAGFLAACETDNEWNVVPLRRAG